MLAAALALALSAGGAGAPHVEGRLPPAPRELYRVAWQRPFVPLGLLEYEPGETGGVAIDAATGLVVFGTRDGWMHAVRPDGSVVWEHQAKAGFAGPATIAGGTVFAGSRDGRLYAVAATTGKLIWKYDTKEELGTRPTVSNGIVYVATLQDTLVAVDAKTGTWKWHHRREPRPGFSIRGAADVVVGDGVVYGGYSDGTVTALDAATGRVIWERMVAPVGDQADVDGLVLDGGRLYGVAYSGLVGSVDARTGNVIWKTPIPGAHVVTVGRGLVFTVTGSSVVALSLADGSQVWSSPIVGGSAAGAPLLVGRWLAVPAATAGLRWLEAATGRVVRVFDPGPGVSGPPAVRAGRMYVLSDGGTLFALDLS